MKKIHLVAFLLLAGLFACRKKEIISMQDDPLTLNSRPVNPGLLGFNTGSTFYFIRPDIPKSLTISEFWLDSLQPRSFRFPGGRDANFYHYYGKAYGFKEAEFKGGHSEGAGVTSLWQEVAQKENGYPEGVNVRIPFVDMVNRQQQAGAIFTLNVWSAEYEENKANLQWLLSQGVKFDGFELGNEMYLGVYRDTLYTDVQHYIDRMKSWATRLRSDFPGIPIGIIGAPVREDSANGAYFKTWNDAIAAEDFYDAVTWHHYVKFEPCGVDENAGSTWDCMRDSLVRESQEQLPRGLKYWKTKFPNKKLWVTEWNLAAPRSNFIGSQMAAMYYTQYLLQLARFSSENGNFISYAHHHNLLAYGDFAVMKPDNSIQNDLDKCVRRPGFLPFAYLRDAFDGRSTWLSGESVFDIQTSEGSILSGSFLHLKKSDASPELLVVVVNPYSKAGQLNWSQTPKMKLNIDGRPYYSNLEGAATGFFGANLQSGEGGETELKRIQFDFKGELTIPAYSVMVLRLPLLSGG